MRARLLRAGATALLVALSHASTPAPPEDDPLASIGNDPQTLSQLLQWSLANQDLDALHRKAEAIRRGGATEGSGVELTGDGKGLPAPTSAGAAAAESVVKQLTPERKAELDALYQEMMPDTVGLMREALAKALDVSLDEEAREAGLIELEELVDDIDNAKDLRTIGGLVDVVGLLAADASPPLQAGAAWVLGSAVKNHRELQLYLLGETRALASLLALLTSHRDAEVRAKTIYALSALLRNCPEAQAAFGKADGVGALRAVLADGGSGPKLVRKALVLVTDLLREQRLALETADAAIADVATADADKVAVGADGVARPLTAVAGAPGGAAEAAASSEGKVTASDADAGSDALGDGDAGEDETPMKASVQFMMTHAMRQRLTALGYSADEIYRLDSAEAARILREAGSDAADGPTFVGTDGTAAATDEEGAVGGLGPLALWANASELTCAVVECLRMAGDVDAQEKALLALDELVKAQLLRPSSDAGGAADGGCSMQAIRAGVAAFRARCESALQRQRQAGARGADGDDEDDAEGVGACEELLVTAHTLDGALRSMATT